MENKYKAWGFSTGEIEILAENASEALQKIATIEWECACAYGTYPDYLVLGQVDEQDNIVPKTGLMPTQNERQ